MLTCKCGSVLVSDGKVWTCPISRQDLYEEHSKDIPDLRLTAAKSVTVCRQPGPAGPPTGRPRRKVKLHKDTFACCEACNPTGYRRARHNRELLARRGR